MTTKYWQLKIQGERSADEIQTALGRSGGILVRVHIEKGETHVYLAGDKPVITEMPETFKIIRKPTAVNLEKILKLG